MVGTGTPATGLLESHPWGTGVASVGCGCVLGVMCAQLHMWQFLDSLYHLQATLAHDTTDRASAISWGSIT